MPATGNPRRTPRPYRPISPEAWGRLLAYLRQAQAHLASPTVPPPDPSLLVDGEHGPFLYFSLGTDKAGRPVLSFMCTNTHRKDRYAPPEVILMLRLILAYGGGCSSNDNGAGLSYVRLFGGHDRLDLGRLVTGAGRGEVAVQTNEAGQRTDFRHQDPAHFTRTPMRDQAARVPTAGREQAIAKALSIHRKNAKHAGFKVTEAAYELIIRDAFALLDAVREPAA